MNQYFPKLYDLGGHINVKMDLPNYATKTNLNKSYQI